MNMDISMDIHAKSADMDMDEKFHIHGNPGRYVDNDVTAGAARCNFRHQRLDYCNGVLIIIQESYLTSLFMIELKL